jgi:NAD(P)H-hydrate repair Nnr-like enzyme with NAD(P)H-hydrate epimerase domain
MLLLDATSAADELVERLHASAELLAGLQGPAGQQDAAAAGRLQLLQVHYTTVQLWARRGKFEKAAGVIDAMLTGLGV